jgi:AcrR family transcriptional regulator
MVYRRTARSDAIRAASRERILSAALDLFGKKGYDATTMHDIVTRAGTSIGNAYFYFRNKEAVAVALAESTSHALYDHSEQVTAGIPPGSARVAAMMAWNLTAFFTGGTDLARLVSATDQRQSVVNVVGDVAVARWIPTLGASFPDRSREELPLMAAAIWGSARSLAEKIGRGRLELPPAAATEFLVRWNLRALGLSPRQVDSTWARTARFVARTARESARDPGRKPSKRSRSGSGD